MKLEFGLGSGIQTVDIPDKNLMMTLRASEVTAERGEEEEVRFALNHPIGTLPLREIVHRGEKAVIVTSDITRPMPTARVLPLVVEELTRGGVLLSDITVVVAIGSHRNQSEEEKKQIMGEELYTQINCIDSDPEDVVHFGLTSRGTPVDITRAVAEADRIICLGNIEYHYFAGYSGGAKAIMPGVSTRAAIQSNHSMMIQERAFAGNIETNPVRCDIDEAGSFVGIDFILNVVLDEHKRIIKAVAGDYIDAHRAGCRFLDTVYLKQIPEEADIVIVSQGGAPKDLNLYQTQKALDNARHAVKQGGVIILLGSCKEGLGESVFERWMTESPSPEYMIDKISRDFQLGGHKAAAIAITLKKADIYLVSDMEDDFVRSIFMEPFKNAQQAFDRAIKKMGTEASVIAMPFGGSTLPKLVAAH